MAKSDCWIRHVCPSVRMEQLGFHWKDFFETWFLSIFRKTVEKIQVSLKSDNNNGTVRNKRCTVLIISGSSLIKMRTLSDKSCRENHNSHFMFFFVKNRAVSETMWKNIVQPGRPQSTVWSMRIECRITKATDTLKQCNTHCLSTATEVSGTRVIVTLNRYRLSCWRKASLLYCHNWTSGLTAWNSCDTLRKAFRAQTLINLHNFNLRNCRLEKFSREQKRWNIFWKQRQNIPCRN